MKEHKAWAVITPALIGALVTILLFMYAQTSKHITRADAIEIAETVPMEKVEAKLDKVRDSISQVSQEIKQMSLSSNVIAQEVTKIGVKLEALEKRIDLATREGRP